MYATYNNNTELNVMFIEKGADIEPSLASNPIICSQIRWNRRKALMVVLAVWHLYSRHHDQDYWHRMCVRSTTMCGETMDCSDSSSATSK